MTSSTQNIREKCAFHIYFNPLKRGSSDMLVERCGLLINDKKSLLTLENLKKTTTIKAWISFLFLKGFFRLLRN